MTSRRLAPGERVDGVAVFECPAFKESNERLELRMAQADQVDHPMLVPCHFIAMRFPMNQVTDKNATRRPRCSPGWELQPNGTGQAVSSSTTTEQLRQLASWQSSAIFGIPVQPSLLLSAPSCE